MLTVFQVVFVLSSVFGAFMSSIFSGTYGSVPGVSITQSFVGGALIIFGARLAGGCTRYIFYNCCYNNILLIRYWLKYLKVLHTCTSMYLIYFQWTWSLGNGVIKPFVHHYYISNVSWWSHNSQDSTVVELENNNEDNLTKVRPLFTLLHRGSDNSPLLIVSLWTLYELCPCIYYVMISTNQIAYFKQYSIFEDDEIV